MSRQLLRNSWTHRPHRPLRPTIRTTHLAPNRHITRDTRHQDNASLLGPIRDHLFRSQLCGMIDAFHIYVDEFLVFFERRIEESEVPVYPGAGDADVEFSGEIGREGGEALSEAF
jgi:hypothetical protein